MRLGDQHDWPVMPGLQPAAWACRTGNTAVHAMQTRMHTRLLAPTLLIAPRRAQTRRWQTAPANPCTLLAGTVM
jgi:hypothetical protein